MPSTLPSRSRLVLRSPLRWLGSLIALLAIVLTALAFIGGFFDRDAIHLYGMRKTSPTRVAAVYYSGDMGLRFGMGTHVAPMLAARGIPVFGVSMPALFNEQRSQAEVNAMLAATIRDALAQSGARKLVLMGQSFGSDILVAGLDALTPELRSKVAAVVLVVPGQKAYFRADPTGLRYLEAPDADEVTAIKRMTWAPLICIFGQAETDSLCPSLLGSHAKVIEMPGGHFLHNDHDRLVATMLTALGPIIGQEPEQAK